MRVIYTQWEPSFDRVITEFVPCYNEVAVYSLNQLYCDETHDTIILLVPQESDFEKVYSIFVSDVLDGDVRKSAVAQLSVMLQGWIV